MPRRSAAIILGVVAMAAAGLAATVLFASLSPPESSSMAASRSTEAPPSQDWESQLRSNRTALRGFIDDPARLEGHIRVLVKTAALAGTEASMHQVQYVENYWRQLGFKVVRRTYEVPVSYFNTTDRPSVSICQRRPDSESESDCVQLEMDKPLTPEDNDTEGISRTFYAYTKPLSGDFGLLLLSDIRDKRGDIAEQMAGNLVLIMPNETAAMEALSQMVGGIATGFLLVHTPPGNEDENDMEMTEAAAAGSPAAQYPNGTGSPDTAVTFHLGLGDNVVGDPTTPGYPSKWYASRKAPRSSWASMLNATIIPISEADAEQLVEAYFAIRAASSEASAAATFLRVDWPLGFGYRPVHDSCAEVPGWAEPDRVVLLGSHRDAWYGGAIDPHTGVATLLETGAALSRLMGTGWRPRRTVLMCAWDAEEIGLMGSVEWVEEEYQRAGARLVAYYNTDTDIMGNWKILVQASDQMVDVIRSVMSEMPNPTASLAAPSGPEPASSPYFFFHQLDDSSDYFAFTRALGVPACDLSYIRGPREALVLYDLYHTRYETVRLYRMLDPGGLAHQGLARAVASLVYTFADSPLLPLNMSAFAAGLRSRLYDGLAALSSSGEGEGEGAEGAASRELLGVLKSALNNATRALDRFEGRLAEARAAAALSDRPLEQRMLNDKIMLVQKAFTHHCVYPCEKTVNLLNGLDKTMAPIEKLVQAIILGLNSVPKILTDSFVEE